MNGSCFMALAHHTCMTSVGKTLTGEFVARMEHYMEKVLESWEEVVRSGRAKYSLL